MKKLLLVTLFSIFIISTYAGGLLTNYNQSVQYSRMMSRNASFQIDAVFYNPAGLAFMENGWHFAINNQSIWQNKTTNSEFPLLNRKEYVGEVVAPIFPSVYAVYKKDKWAFSFGFNPVGGGGSAKYKEGIPSFEIPLSKLPVALQGLTEIDPSLKIDGYDVDLSFEGSSIFWGFQLGATYKFNDKVSAFGGVRYIPAINTYEGSITNIAINTGGKIVNAQQWMTGVSGNLSSKSEILANTAETIQPIIESNAGQYTLNQLEGAGYITALQKAQFEVGLQQLGLNSSEINAMNIATIQNTFNNTSDKLCDVAQGLTERATDLSDKKVKTEQTGNAFTPIIGVNFKPNENWLFAIKYEMETVLTLKNDTEVDNLGLFKDGEEVESNIPAIFALGIGYTNSKLNAQFSFNHYFDKSIDSWGINTRDAAIYGSESPESRKREIDKNLWEIGLGIQYKIIEMFALSFSTLYGETGVARSYQSDLSNSNNSASFATGFEWKINKNITFDTAVNYTFYKEEIVPFKDPDFGNYIEKYDKSSFSLSAGLTYSIFK